MKEHIERAYSLLSKIMVCGDDVDRMALARQELRQAFAIETTQASDEKKEGDK